MKGIIKLASGVVVIILLATIVYPIIMVTAAGHSAAIDPSAAQKMLAATVQIRMFAPAPGQPDKDVVADGLGTVVQVAGLRYVVTHDHWGFVYDNLSRVVIWDANHQPMADLNGSAFQALVHYRDSSTLVFAAPPAVAVVAAGLNEGQVIGAGDVVQVIHHPAGSTTEVEVIQAVAVLKSSRDGRPTLILHSLDGRTIVHGDSGGGIWHDGRLAGNMWLTINTLGDQATAISIMASLPAEAQSQMTVEAHPAGSTSGHLAQILMAN
jgi:hypothetical protein